MQLQVIRKYCHENNINLIESYIDEAKTGTNVNRKSFQRMVHDANDSVWDTIIVYKMDRLSRSVKDAIMTKAFFEDLDKKIISIIEDFDEKTPEGSFFHLITLGMSQFYVDNLRRESWRGMMLNAHESKYLGGKITFGYDVDSKNRYLVNEQEAIAVRKMFELVASGHSYSDIDRFLDKSEIRTKEGKKIHPAYTEFLRNEKYKGVYVWNLRTSKSKTGSRNNHKLKPLDQIVRIDGGIPAIVDIATFEKVQKILDLRSARGIRRGPAQKYLLTGLLKCDYCKSSVCGQQGHSGRYKYLLETYRCTKPKTKTQSCRLSDINMNYLDQYVTNVIEHMILNSDNAILIYELLNGREKSRHEQLETEKSELFIKRDALNEEIKSMAAILAQVSEHQYVKVSDEISQLSYQKNDIEVKLIEIGYALEPIALPTKKQLVTAMRESKKKCQEDKSELKEVLEKFVWKIILNNEEVRIIVNINSFIANGEIDERLLIPVVELRENIANRFNHKYQDFSQERLRKVLHYNEKLQEKES
jgi:site-specific DNA recombinase